MAFFKVSTRHLSGEREKNHEKSQKNLVIVSTRISAGNQKYFHLNHLARCLLFSNDVGSNVNLIETCWPKKLILTVLTVSYSITGQSVCRKYVTY